ncbi:twin-arginine translocase subunit TatC [Desulfovibrio litoralis]
MTLLDHLRELKKRLLRAFMAIGLGFLLCYSFAEPLFNFLVQPLLAVLPEGGKMIYTGLPEAFFAYLKVAFVAGLFVASPLVFYQIWAFISPGLYDEEKRYILPIAFFSAFFFISGGAFAYYVVFPFAFPFFLSYSSETIEAQLKMDEYLSLALQMLFAFGLIFELPLFAFFLSKMGLVTAKAMRRFRRYAILVNFIVAAILTPPDPISQLAMAIPMLALYEVSIWVAYYFGKKEETPEEDPKEAPK